MTTRTPLPPSTTAATTKKTPFTNIIKISTSTEFDDTQDFTFSPILSAILSKKEYDASQEESPFIAESGDFDLKPWADLEIDSSSQYLNEDGIIEAWSWIDSVDSWIENV